MRLFRPVTSLAPAALLILASPLASAAGKTLVSVTNTSDDPVLGMVIEALEPGTDKPSRTTPAMLPAPLMPGEKRLMSVPDNPELVARGGQQRLRWYWTPGRECVGQTQVAATTVPIRVNTGPRTCRAGYVPPRQQPDLEAGLAGAEEIARGGDLQGALYAFNALLASHGQQASIFHSRGGTYLLERWDDFAMADFEAESQLSPDRAHRHFDLAWVAFVKDDLAEALVQADLAVQAAPDDPEHLLNRGGLHCQMGRAALAAADEQAAVRLGARVENACGSGQ